MKKQFLLLLFLIVALASCEGPTGPPGRDGLDGDGVGWNIKTFVVRESEWKEIAFDDGYRYWECSKSYSELTNFVYGERAAVGYIILDPGLETETLATLGYTIFDREIDENGDPYDWEEVYSFEYEPGWVHFLVRCDDFANVRPPEREFRVVLLY